MFSFLCGQSIYVPHFVSDLPPLDLAPDRSPPPGRQRYKKRARSSTSSPLHDNKTSRIHSPKTAQNNTDDDTNNEEISSEVSSINNLDIVSVQDKGEVSSMAVRSPKTGNLTFEYKKRSIDRRQSLNCLV